jgi:hypothetical protein
MNKQRREILRDKIRQSENGTVNKYFLAEHRDGEIIHHRVVHTITPDGRHRLEISKEFPERDNADAVIEILENTIGDWKPIKNYRKPKSKPLEVHNEPPEEHHEMVNEENWEISHEEAEELERIKEVIRLYNQPEG